MARIGQKRSVAAVSVRPIDALSEAAIDLKLLLGLGCIGEKQAKGTLDA